MEYTFETVRRLSKMKATKVKNAYMKKKDPLFVRESLLNAAFELAATKGMADVTVNKVSELADVTKGAFFHHFDSKETLVKESPLGNVRQFAHFVDGDISHALR